MNTNSENSQAKVRVVVAMSGGVDSSVAPALMVEQGYEVIGMMLRLWSEPGREAFNRCCTPDQMADARRMADQLGIPFYAIDVQNYFRKTIVQYFIDQYAEGDTPNPCIECNRQIRFKFLFDHAMAMDADYLVTGHYARIQHDPLEGYSLWRGVDTHKDQSYVLHVLGQAQLAKVLFPVGQYTKARVRELATKFEFPVAQKSDSMDLCFLGKDRYEAFLERNAPDIGRSGPIYSADGKLLGTHQGLPFYTIGQRKGLGLSSAEPLFVIAKDSARNALIVGSQQQQGLLSLRVERVNWIHDTPTEPVEALVQVRYKNRPTPATITPLPNQEAIVTFAEPVTGVASGQGAVFYVGERCLGGGIIQREKESTQIPLTMISGEYQS